MKDSIIRRIRMIRNPFGGDLFKRTQNRLTLQYTGLLIIFLGIFIIFVYVLLDSFSFYQQEIQLRDLAVQQSNVIKEYIIHNNDKELTREQENVFSLGQEQFFYYLLDKDGHLLVGNEMIHPLRTDLLRVVGGWMPKQDEVRYQTFLFGRSPHDKHHEVELLMTGHPISIQGQTVATLYIGKDVSFLNQLLKWLLFILVILVLFFIVLAFFISHFMSKRAMIPIVQSYTKQRQFVADASHELRTPLSVLLSSIDTLQMEEHIENDSFSSNVLSNMKDEVKRMTKLVGDLLTLARSDSEIKLSKESFDVSALSRKIIQTLTPLAGDKQISLGIEAPDNLLIIADMDRVTQLLYILLDNAIKYTPVGGEVDLTLSSLEIRHRQWLRVEIKDTGLGINSEDANRIFDRFYRVDKARSRQQGGHGLGLAIAKWIVDAHHGSIHVSSSTGVGSTFTVNLPIVSNAASSLGPENAVQSTK